MTSNLAAHPTPTQPSLGEIARLREVNGLPYFHAIKDNNSANDGKPSTKESWSVYFAIQLLAATKYDPPTRDRQSVISIEEMLQQHFCFLSAIERETTGLHKAVELRFVSQPDQELPQRGVLRIGFIGKITYHDLQTAIKLADEFHEGLTAMLPLTETQIYKFVPTNTKEEFFSLFSPFQITDVGEIVRREELIGIGENKEIYVVYPFSGVATSSLHDILWKILNQKQRYILSMCIVPTRLEPWEIRALQQYVDLCDSIRSETEYTDADDSGKVTQSTRYSTQARATAAGKLFQQYLYELSGSVKFLKIQVASDGIINQGVLDTVGTEVGGVPYYSPDKAIISSGGYHIIRPNSIHEFDAATRNLHTLNVIPWAYSIAPEDLKRLRYLTSSREAFNAFRLPIPTENGVPGVDIQMVKYAPLPKNTPSEGIVLGESISGGIKNTAKVRIKTEDRCRHIYLVGKTGTGKSTLLLQMALADIENGSGVCVVDPHGELVEDILSRIPPKRLDDVIVFDPSDSERPLGLNMLEAETEQEKHLIVNEMIGLMYKIYDPKHTGIIGPRFEHAIRNAMLTVMSKPDQTLIEVVGVLTSPKYLEEFLPFVKDKLIESYWRDQIANTSDFHKSEVLDYIVSKFGRFITNRLVRNIIGQKKSAFDFREIIDQRKILLVNLSKGKIGAENSTFLGSIIVPKLLIAALSRVNIPKEKREPYFLYVDEFQNFASDTFSSMLSEARKYGLSITMAHQYLEQIPFDIRSAVFGNVGTLIAFRVGVDDAKQLLPEFYPVFQQDDLTNLTKFTACIKLLVDGISVRPFSMKTIFDKANLHDDEVAEKAREMSREKYGISREEVEQQIESRMWTVGRRY